MPRTCTICGHPERKRIEAALIELQPFRHIAAQYAVSTTALQRHKSEHLPAKLAKSREAQEMTDSEKLLRTLQGLLSRSVQIMEKAETKGDLRSALGGIREARACAETLLEVQGELQRGTTINIVQSGEWVTIRTAVLNALDRYPEARLAVANALIEAERAGE